MESKGGNAMAQYPMSYPYGNPYGYQQPMANYQPMDRLAQIQQNYAQALPTNYQQSQISQQPMMGLNGEIVDSIDVVRAKNVDMSGAVVYYPKADMTEIFTKQLQPDGTSRILTYRISQDIPKEAAQQPVTPETLNEMFVQLRQDLLSEINGIKEMIPTLFGTVEPSKNERGGGQK